MKAIESRFTSHMDRRAGCAHHDLTVEAPAVCLSRDGAADLGSGTRTVKHFIGLLQLCLAEPQNPHLHLRAGRAQAEKTSDLHQASYSGPPSRCTIPIRDPRHEYPSARGVVAGRVVGRSWEDSAGKDAKGRDMAEAAGA
jgi:hypothetical protein